MRVISGSARGRKLDAPPGGGTRPITDRAKEAIFNMLESMGGVEDSEVADLYAGSGSFGIECLSRGAARVTFVERDRRAAQVLTANLDRLGFIDQATVVVAPVETALARIGSVDLAFCDPPYADDPWQDLLARLSASRLVGHAEFEIPLSDRWIEIRRRNYGRSKVVVADLA